LDVELGAAFGLDLLVSVSAAIDVEAGVYLTLPELAFVEINLFTKTICDSNLYEEPVSVSYCLKNPRTDLRIKVRA
jgi:hypothetical protein